MLNTVQKSSPFFAASFASNFALKSAVERPDSSSARMHSSLSKFFVPRHFSNHVPKSSGFFVGSGFTTGFGSGFGVSSFATIFARKSSGPRPLATCASMHSTLSGSRVSRHARRSDSKSTFGAFEGSGIAGLSPCSGSSVLNGVEEGSCFAGESACDWLRCCAAMSNAGITSSPHTAG